MVSRPPATIARVAGGPSNNNKRGRGNSGKGAGHMSGGGGGTVDTTTTQAAALPGAVPASVLRPGPGLGPGPPRALGSL